MKKTLDYLAKKVAKAETVHDASRIALTKADEAHREAGRSWSAARTELADYVMSRVEKAKS